MTGQKHLYAEHRFRFAAWAAARAIQQPTKDGFSFKTKEAPDIFKAICFDKIAGKDDWLLKIDDFDTQHAAWRDKLVKHKKGMTHGRAAKLINVFIKTLMPSDMSKVSDELQERWSKVHPPIDRIMLKNMNMKKCKFGNINWEVYLPWTQLKSCEYQELIDNIRQHEPCLWKIERFWKP